MYFSLVYQDIADELRGHGARQQCGGNCYPTHVLRCWAVRTLQLSCWNMNGHHISAVFHAIGEAVNDGEFQPQTPSAHSAPV